MNKVSQVLHDHSQQILSQWEISVNQHVTASHNTNNMVLRDHLPNMINDIADVLIRFHGQSDPSTATEKFLEIVENSTDHGRHRAASATYTVDQVVHEYIIFHRVMTDVLRAHRVYDAEVADLLKYVLETAILQSVTAFTASLQEMQAKLVGSLAHDLRNPITNSLGLAKLMSCEKGSEHFEKLRTMMQRSLQKSLDLTEGLLDSITAEAGEGMMLTFYEDDMVKEIKTVHQEAIHIYNQEIRLVCPSDEIVGIMDGTAIRRLLENLITNAVKYGDANQPVTIEIEDYTDTVNVSVLNYGNPISSERQQSIFEFMDRGDQGTAMSTLDHPGWGIGLSLVRVVAESHGGTVSLSSSEEKGTRFTIELSKRNEPGKRRTRFFSD